MRLPETHTLFTAVLSAGVVWNVWNDMTIVHDLSRPVRPLYRSKPTPRFLSNRLPGELSCTLYTSSLGWQAF